MIMLKEIGKRENELLEIETQYVSSLFKWLTWLWCIYHQFLFYTQYKYLHSDKMQGINVYTFVSYKYRQ